MLLVFLGAALAGCAGDGTPAATSAAPTNAPEAVVAADVGSVAGLVVNEELVPIERARAGLVERQLQATTDAAGRFTFNDLEPGSYTAIAEALGYEATAMKVSVVAGEVAEIRLALTAIAVVEAFTKVLPHTFFIEACGFDVVGVCDNAATCPDCNWPIDFKDDPSQFILEIFGRHSVPKPQGKNGLMHYAYKNEIGPRLWGCSDLEVETPPCGVLPIKLNYTREEYTDVKKLLIYQTCEMQWFCAQEKYDDWFTFFFNYEDEDIPPEYSAAPKP